MTSGKFLRPGGTLALIVVVAGLMFALPAKQSAHDIPGDVTVQALSLIHI